MGLDMYLDASKFISPYASLDEPEGKLRAAIASVLGLKDDPLPDETIRRLLARSDIGKVTGVRVRAGYWRKSHNIHQWFVDNVQGGDDNCGEYYVDRGDLKELVDYCQEQIDDGDDPDGEYLDTIQMIKPILDTPLYEGYEFYYKASW